MEVKKEIVKDSELNKEFNITIPLELVSSRIEMETLEKLKTYRLDGFRPGKVPLEIFKKKEGDYLFIKIAESMISDAVFDISDENKYELSGQPKVNIKTMEINKDIEINVVYELMPNVPEIDFSKIKLDKYNIVVGENRVNRAIDELLSTYKKWIKKDDISVLGDSVKIDFVGKVNGAEFSGGRGENYQLELGSHSFIDNFEEQLIGKKDGDKVTVNVTFPESYHNSSLAGKAAVFEVKVLEVLRSEKNDLTDDFVKGNFGSENVEKFKEVLIKELENSYNKTARSILKEKIFDKLIDIVNFTLPENIVEEQFKAEINRIEDENLKNGKNEKIDEEKIRDIAKQSVKITYIIYEIAKNNEITVTDDDITFEIMNRAMAMPGYEKIFIDFYRKNKKALDSVKKQILEDKVVDFVIEKMDKNEISMSDEDFEKINN